MQKLSWFRAILSAVIGLIIAVIVTAVANLLKPAPDVAWALVSVCLSSLVSALAGYLMGARQKLKVGTAASG